MTTDKLIYLDNNATTRVAPEVVEAMTATLTDDYGNPSSSHPLGQRAATRVEDARTAVADLLRARPEELVFTSGGTEADNAALRGVLAARPNRRHVVISAVEHHAVTDLAPLLRQDGITVDMAPVDNHGRLRLDALRELVTDQTAIIALMLANNETGVIQPVHEAARIAHAAGALLFCDAVQAAGKITVDVGELEADLLAISAHKLHGPKGTGALFIRRGTPFRPQMIGGHQEQDRRGGTQNTAGIVGLGRACRLAAALPSAEHVRNLRDAFEAGLGEQLPSAVIVGRDAPRLPNTTCLCVPDVSAEPLLMLLGEAGICVSSGAACSSGAVEPSHVLAACGIQPQLAQGELRVSFGKYNTMDDVRLILEHLPRIVRRIAEFGAVA